MLARAALRITSRTASLSSSTGMLAQPRLDWSASVAWDMRVSIWLPNR